ncbi:MAG: anti-sigma factor family protein, partial [Candidatus Zixiibacteriota bacterium]
MDHSYFRDKISAYFDNELPPQEKEIVEQHLAQCQECQNLLAELKQLEQVVEKQSQLTGEDYWEQSAKRIEQRLGFSEEAKVTVITPSRWKSLVPKVAAVAASIAVLGFIALYQREISKDVGLQAPQTPPPAEAVYPHDTADFLNKQLRTLSEETLSQKYEAMLTSKQTAQDIEQSKLSPDKPVSGQLLEKSEVIQQRSKQPIKKAAELTASVVEREAEKKAVPTQPPITIESAGQAVLERVTYYHDSIHPAARPVEVVEDILALPETAAQAAEFAEQPKIQVDSAMSGE